MAEFRVLRAQERNFREEIVVHMEEVQVGNGEEGPAEEVAGVVEATEIEDTLQEQPEIEEPETELEGQAETGEIEISPEEQADDDAEPGIELQVGDVNGDILSEEAEDQSEMGGIPVEDWDYQRPRRGEVRTGIILSIDEQEIIADVGAKRDGIVPYADMQRMGEEALAELRVGSEVSVYVLRPEDKEGNLLISLYMARQQQAWIRAQELADSGEIWEGEVVGYNKGGLVVPVDEIRGFVPASQVPGFPHGLSQEERLARLSTMVGEKLPFKVIEINRRKRRLILSSTSAQQTWRKQARKRLLDDLREGEVRKGTVSSLCSFGAFVDLGGADGLVHISELSWRRIRHPREVVSVGEEVEVYILRLDHERQRIGLSLKRLQPEPWSLVEDKYELGQLIEGVVTNVVDFGAFAEVEEGVEGLIHVSELAEAPISHPRDVVKKGDLLLLRVIRIDTRRKRLGLSLKRVLESEWSEWAARLAAAEGAEEAEQEVEKETLEVEAEPEAEPVEEVGAEEAAEASTEPAEEPTEEPIAEAAEDAAEAEVESVEGAVAEAVEEAAEAETEPDEEAVAEAVEDAAEAEVELVGEAVAEAVEDAVEAEVELVGEAVAEAVEDAAEAEAEPDEEAVAEAVEDAAEAEAEPDEEAVAEAVEDAAEAEVEPGEEAVAEAAEDAAEAETEPVGEAVAEAVEDAAEAETEPDEEAVGEAVEDAAETELEPAEEAVAEAIETVEDSAVDEEAAARDPEPAAVQT